VAIHITAYCYVDGNRESNMLDVGDATPAGESGWKIEIDGVQQDWNDKRDDNQDGSAANLGFGEGSYGRISYVAPVGSTVNIVVNAENKTGGAKDHYVRLSVVMCPWIIPDDEYDPLTLDFSQGSTFYMLTEPLHANPTKTVKIGKERFVSFGDATDYYDTDSGAGILETNYTFEIVDVTKIYLMVSGFGGCVSTLGVDIR
jgi:hypothetical protein